jgi:anthranilate phosphoribosyltransferase
MTQSASGSPGKVGLDIRELLARVVERRDLTAEEMAQAVGQIMDGEGTAAQVGALLTALRMKGETVDEVVGAAMAMRARMLRVPFEDANVLDTCGTGGDGSGSVNISTLASFVLAACGVRVAKHGNRALSSRSGSHDVIEALGLDPAPSPELAARCLREAGLCFMFAPTYHAATKAVAGPRREIGFRTLFNLLGPLTNPAGTVLHLNGVFAPERCEFLARAHKALGSRRALVVHGAGGLDEIAPAGLTQVAELTAEGEIRLYQIGPRHFGLPESDPAGLQGGEPQMNARILLQSLEGAPGAVRLAAVMTAGAGLYVAGAVPDLAAGATRALDALDSGRALGILQRLRALAPLAPR